MTRSLPSKLLIAFSSILLAHACYSAHEHSLLLSSTPSPHDSPSATPISGTTLPLDITLETLISVSLLLVGIISSGWELKPISLRSYAGGVESGRVLLDGKKVAGLFDGLEERPGFLDVRKQRKEFADWIKTQG